MTQYILAAILSLMPGPSPKWNESNAEFQARMQLVAHAIADASRIAHPAYRQELAMAVVVTFWGESRFSPLIQAGEHRGDSGKAICLGQHHQNELSREEWLGLAGTDLESTTRCARLTAERLKSAWHYCPEHSWPAAFVLYGSGRTCHADETQWSGIFRDRARKWATITAQLH